MNALLEKTYDNLAGFGKGGTGQTIIASLVMTRNEANEIEYLR